MKFCSFDIETATLTPDNEDPHKYRPLGIACAATQLVDTELGFLGIREAVTWAGWSGHGPIQAEEMYASRMPHWQVWGLIDYLTLMAEDGYQPLTWNGLGFDFDILAEEAANPQVGRDAAKLAMSQYDMAFQMLCSKGYMIGMQAAAEGLGLKGKRHLEAVDTSGHGELAPVLWVISRAEQDKVLEYVKQDVQTTSEIAIAISDRHQLSWISKSGRPNVWKVPQLLNVVDSLGTALPDTSWMAKPRTRESCYDWTKRYWEEGDV